MAFDWNGVFPAIITPFTSNDELDITMFKHNIIAQQEAGVSGLIIGGSLGEASTITTQEKEVLVKTAIETVDPQIPVLLNIAEGSTREAIHQAKLASNWGARGLMLLPPMRYRSDENETVSYFRSVAASTELPIMIYNNPVDYKTEITPSMFEALTEHANIQAVKESTRDTSNVTRMINSFGDRFKILCGVDTIAMEEILLGAHGWVAGLVNAFPNETVTLYEYCISGKIEEANELNRWFMPLLELDIHPKLVQYIKLAAQFTGLGTEYVRSPRMLLEGTERKEVNTIITRALENRPVLDKV